MKRSKFSLSHYKLFSCSPGELVPIGLLEVLPGDSIQHATSLLLRVLPLLAPVMHPMEAKIHQWFVPHRLVWEDFEDFITGGPDGMDASVFPTVTTTAVTGFAVGSLADYLGVTPLVPDEPVSALPFRGYARIFNEWYRDQDLQTPLVIDETSGPDTTTSLALVNTAWGKDYFTTARPWAQKGPEVSIPLTGSAPVLGIGGNNAVYNVGPVPARESDGNIPNYANYKALNTAGANDAMLVEEDPLNAGFPNIRADLSAASAVTIGDLRTALALQRFEEARARYGSRYPEYLLSAFGVRSSDARLQRPEYLGGGKQTIQFSEVLQTAPTTDGDDTVGVGNLKGHGIGALRSNRYRRFFEEHGYVFTLLSVKPRTMYVQGLHRTWNRRVKEDFYTKDLQHIGQQEVLNKELYLAHTNPDGTFGFQDRYDEYRRMESSIAGEFRTTLDYWHMARIFASDPALNASFVSSNPTNRIYSVTSDSVDKLWCMANHSIQARRLVSSVGSSFTF